MVPTIFLVPHSRHNHILNHLNRLFKFQINMDFRVQSANLSCECLKVMRLLKMKMFFTVIILIIISVVLGSVFLSNWNIPAPTKTVSEVIDDSKFRN